MEAVFEASGLTKRFGEVVALDRVELAIPKRSIVGLLGRNGSGKTTLLRHLMGIQLPTEGRAVTLSRPSPELGHAELSRIGFVPQEIRLIDGMTVKQHLDYVATFFPSWDSDRQARLLRELELGLEFSVGSLSSGNRQKLALILACCHHPDLLVLDESVSDLDPIARAVLLQFLLELLREDETTIVVSSHVLRDVEKIVDRVLCLERGRVVTDAALDELKERYAEWRVLSGNGDLPARFEEPFVFEQEVEGRQARLVVRAGPAQLDAFRAAHRAEVAARPLNLEEMFPILLREDSA